MPTTNGNMMRIGLLDHMGYGNLGDAATQDVAIANIKKRLPNAQLVGFSFVPSDTTMRHGIPCYPIRWWFPKSPNAGNSSAQPEKTKPTLKSTLKENAVLRRFAKPILDLARELLFWVSSYKAVRQLNALIISGGGQLSDLWHGPWSHPYAIFKFCILAKISGKKLYFLNVGAGPLDHRLSKLFAKYAVQLADYRSFRDDDSRALLRNIGVNSETHVYPDLAYGLDVAELRRSSSGVSSPSLVGINPIGFCDPRNWPRKDAAVYQAYLEKMACFSGWLLERGYRLRIFTNEASLDHYAIEDLRQRLSSKVTPNLLGQISCSASGTVKDVLHEISQFDFVITSKYHGIIFSQVLGKPVISLSYGRKMDSAMQSVGQERFNARIESVDADWLIETFQSLVDERDRIIQESTLAVNAYAARLSQQFDSLFLSEQL
jgi:polysaccharide pyruvyl transferase WcaK-like protein